MKLLKQIGWYGLNRILVLETDDQGQILSCQLLYKEGPRLLLKDWAAKDNASELLDAHPALPIVLALKQQHPVEEWLTSFQSDPLEVSLGLQGPEQKEFIFELFPRQEGPQWICIIRKERIENVLNAFPSLRERIVHINFSRLPLLYLIPALPNYLPEHGYQLEHYYWGEGTIIGPTEPAIDLSLAELAMALDMPKELLFPYASAVNFFLHQSQQVKEQLMGLRPAKNWQSQRKWLRIGSFLSLGMGIISLALGLGKESMGQSNQALRYRLDNPDQTERALQKSVAELQTEWQQLQESTQSFSYSKVSFWLDRTASLSPEGIQFIEWLYAPSKAQLKKHQLDHLSPSPLIVIIGQSSDAALISQFAHEVRDMLQVKEVRIEQSIYDFQQQTYGFKLLIWEEPHNPSQL